MFENKIKFSRIFILPLFFLAIINTSLNYASPFSIIKTLNPQECRLLNGLTRNSFELISKEMQDQLYGAQGKKDIADEIVNLIKEVVNEIGEFPEVEIKKMSSKASYTIAAEYRFIGVAPTNKTIYIDEDYFKANILSQTKEAQKLIIRTALKHYLNSTYTKVRASRFLTSSLAGMVAGKVCHYSVNALSRAASNFFYPSEADVCHATSNNSFDAVKNLGIFVAKATIGTLIATKAYNALYGVLDIPTQKYLEYKENQFDKEAVQQKSIREKIKLAQQWMQLRHNGPTAIQHDFIMKNRIRNALPDAHREFAETTNKFKLEFESLKNQGNQQAINKFIESIDTKENNFYAQELKDYIVDCIMNDWKNKFYKAKKNSTSVQNFIVKSPADYFPILKEQLKELVEEFNQKEVIPFYNQLIDEKQVD